MLFRLNFLVIFICAVVKNEYMLYYICAMHTYWFVTVYITMATLPSWNEHPVKMAAKFLCYIVANAIIFEVPGICEKVFYPFWFILGFHENRFPLMHEWAFRAGLDHWACLIGMVCAYNYPHFENLMQKLESGTTNPEKRINNAIKGAIGVAVVFLLYIWYTSCMRLEKFSYNKIHPYSSWIPIVCFIVLRNLFKIFRQYYIHLFAWLGKITLETYLSQLHIYLQSNAKDLIIYIPKMPLLNFAFATTIYLPLSYVLFKITLELNTILLPNSHKDSIRRVVLLCLLLAVSFVISYFLLNVINIKV